MRRSRLIAIAIAAAIVAVMVALVLRRHADDGPSARSTKTGAPKAHEPIVVGPHEPAWLAATPKTRIAGTVYLDGKPASADVELATLAYDFELVEVTTLVHAGADGRFDFGPQAALPVRIAAQVAGAAPAVIEIDPRVAPADHLELFLATCVATVRGEVRDASGGAIDHAAILLGGFVVTRTDASGSYSACVPARSIEIRVRADGYAIATAGMVAQRGVNEQDFALVPEVVIGGHVEDETGHPVPDALVEAFAKPPVMHTNEAALVVGDLYAESRERARVIGATHTDSSGRFELRALPANTYLLRARTDTHAGALVETLAAPGDPSNVTIIVRPGARVSGIARDKATKQPTAHLALTWFDLGGTDFAHTVTGDDGRFTFPPVPVGRGWIYAFPPNYVELDEAVVASAKPVDLVVRRTLYIRGRVERDGKPVGGADVELPNRSVLSAADGTFAIEWEAPDLPMIPLSASDGEAFVTEQLALETGKGLDGVVLSLKFSGSVAGTLVDRQGKPLVGAKIELEAKDIDDYGFSSVASDGTWRATMLHGGAAYQVKATLDGAPLAPGDRPAWPKIDVPSATSHIDGQKLVAIRFTHTLTGKVVAADGAPVADALVVLQGVGRETRSGMDGTFTIETTALAPYTLTARVAGLREGFVSQTPGEAPITITLRDPGRVHVVCAPPEHDVLIMHHGGYAERDASCGDTIGPLLPGAYDVFGEGGDALVTLEPGKTTTATLAPAKPGKLVVTIANPPKNEKVSCTILVGRHAHDGESDTGTVTLSTWQGEREVRCYANGQSGRAMATITEASTARVELK